MYLPTHFAETRLPELHRLLQADPLGMLVTHGPQGLDAEHLPFELDPAPDAAGGWPLGRLFGHVARANPVWRCPGEGAAVMVVFRGAAGYISPHGYPSKQVDPRVVPTWNYEVLHVHGSLHVHEDPRVVRAVVARLTRRHEAGQARPWRMGDAPADYLDGMLERIVGIEVRIQRLEGKRKLSQNRQPHDRQGAAAQVRAAGNEALARAMEGMMDGAGEGGGTAAGTAPP